MGFKYGFVSQPLAPLRAPRTSHLSRRSAALPRAQPRRCCVVARSSGDGKDNTQQFSERSSAEDVREPELVEVGEGDELDDMLSSLSTDLGAFTEKRKEVRSRTRGFLEQITEEGEAKASDADRQPPIDEDETTELVRTAVRACDERKGEDITAIRVSKLTFITSFIVVATGNNAPQIRAISNLVEEDLFKKHGIHPQRRDGTANSGWFLLDYGDLMVNVFSPEARENYKLEALWKEGEALNVSDCITGPGERSDDEMASSPLDDWLSE